LLQTPLLLKKRCEDNSLVLIDFGNIMSDFFSYTEIIWHHCTKNIHIIFSCEDLEVLLTYNYVPLHLVQDETYFSFDAFH
jgi:hypothetical protein